jgi:hypothetical protein
MANTDACQANAALVGATWTARLFSAGTAAALALTLVPYGAPAQTVEERIAREPMIFFVAKGERDACGPGCNEWIAADGNFDGLDDLENRFRKFLDTLNGRNLLVMFNSWGGYAGGGLALGRVLRDRKMAASVGESYPERCEASAADHESCRQIMRENHELKAELRTANAKCASACVYALLGGSERHVPLGAQVAIHRRGESERSSRPGAPTAEQLYDQNKRYILEMGANPDLEDAAQKSSDLRALSRDEIFQYRIETGAPYESDWMLYQFPEPGATRRLFMLKAFTQARGTNGTEFRTTNLRMWCDQSRPGPAMPAIEYQRELASNEIGVPAVIRIRLPVSSIPTVNSLQQVTPRHGDARYLSYVDRQFVQKALSAGTIVFTETLSPSNARPSSREIRLSTAGLEQALRTPLKNCAAT